MVIFCLICLSAWAEAGPNLMPNGNFETVDPANKALASGWTAYGNGYKYVVDPVNSWSGSAYIAIVQTGKPTANAGARQRVTLNQKIARPVRIKSMLLGTNITSTTLDNFGACIYAEIHLMNGQVVYSKNTAKTKNVGTFDWRPIGFNTASFVDQPIAYIDVYAFMGKVSGTAWFDDLFVEEYAAEYGQPAVTIMFDDGYDSVRTAALPLMNTYGWKGSVAIITSEVTSADPLYMNLAGVKSVYSSGWTVASHSVTHRSLPSLSPSVMEDELYDSLHYLNANGIEANHFVLPFGDYNASIWGVCQWYYQSMRGVERGDNSYGVLPWSVLIQEVDFSNTQADIASWLAHAKANNRWLILLFHNISPSANVSDPYTVAPAVFSQALAQVKASGMRVMTYDDAFFEYFTDPPAPKSGVSTGSWIIYE